MSKFAFAIPLIQLVKFLAVVKFGAKKENEMSVNIFADKNPNIVYVQWGNPLAIPPTPDIVTVGIYIYERGSEDELCGQISFNAGATVTDTLANMNQAIVNFVNTQRSKSYTVLDLQPLM